MVPVAGLPDPVIVASVPASACALWALTCVFTFAALPPSPERYLPNSFCVDFDGLTVEPTKAITSLLPVIEWTALNWSKPLVMVA